MKSKTEYNAIEEERKWWGKGGEENNKSRPIPERQRFAHNIVRSKLYDTLLTLECHNTSSILDVGCGSGEDIVHVQKASTNIIGVDLSQTALKKFITRGLEGILADVKNLPFCHESFDYIICSGLLHHLVGQGNLGVYLSEFVRVTKQEGWIVALEPNVFNQSGLLMNVFNSIKPGITGLVPHERALSPLHLAKLFKKAGLEKVDYISASYVWNRFPLYVSTLISKYEDRLRYKTLFKLLGWFEIVYGQKIKTKESIE